MERKLSRKSKEYMKEYMRKRRADPSYREKERKWRAIWRQRNPEKVKEYRKLYYERHPDRIRKLTKELNKRFRMKHRTKGHIEKEFYPLLQKQYPNIFFLNKVIPDGYDPEQKLFIELKLASKVSMAGNGFTRISKSFSGLFFRDNVDRQIDRYPKPLLVIVLNYENGQEVARETFCRGGGG